MVSDAIYSEVPNASLQNVSSVGSIWVIPYNAEINVTVMIGGKAYPIHPLDMSSNVLNNPEGITCLGAVRFFE